MISPVLIRWNDGARLRRVLGDDEALLHTLTQIELKTRGVLPHDFDATVVEMLASTALMGRRVAFLYEQAETATTAPQRALFAIRITSPTRAVPRLDGLWTSDRLANLAMRLPRIRLQWFLLDVLELEQFPVSMRQRLRRGQHVVWQEPEAVRAAVTGQPTYPSLATFRMLGVQPLLLADSVFGPWWTGLQESM